MLLDFSQKLTMNSEKFPEQLILLKTNLDKERPGRKAYQVLDNFAFIVCILRSPSIPVPIFDFPFGFDKSFDKSNACKIHFFLSTTLLKDINEFLEPWEIASTFFLTMERPFVKQDWWNYVGTLCRSLDNRTWICFTMSCKSSRKAAWKNRVLQSQIDDSDQTIDNE